MLECLDCGGHGKLAVAENLLGEAVGTTPCKTCKGKGTVPTAFAKWFHSAYADSPESGAKYLISQALNGTSGSPVWEFLQKTGDKEYTPATFLKASVLIIKEVQE